MEATINPSSVTASPSIKKKVLTGRILNVLLSLFLLVDGAGKILRLAPYVQGTVRVGYSETSIVPLGALVIACTILYLVPRTAVIGALLLTAYLGGATATHVRMGEPFVMPVVFGVLVWVSLYLRDPRLGAFLPWRAPAA